MKDNPFTNCETAEEAKNLYRKLAQENHPDKHPAGEADHWTEEFKHLNSFYATFAAGNARSQAYKRQAEAHANGKKSQADYNDPEELFEEWRRVVEAALNLGVDVELIGMWIWATGPNTYAQREGLKGLGFKWAHKKDDRTAYFNDMGVKSFSRGGYSLDDIRGMHGSTKFQNRRQDQDEPTPTPAFIPATA